MAAAPTSRPIGGLRLSLALAFLLLLVLLSLASTLRSEGRSAQPPPLRRPDARTAQRAPAGGQTAPEPPPQRGLSPTQCTVAWDAPIAGGVVRGFAMEAVGLLSGLAAALRLQPPRRPLATELVLVSTLVEQTFVRAQLRPEAAQVVEQLRGLRFANVYVSQWTPPGFSQRLDSYRARLPRETVEQEIYTVARLMYETTAVPEQWYQGVCVREGSAASAAAGWMRLDAGGKTAAPQRRNAHAHQRRGPLAGACPP